MEGLLEGVYGAVDVAMNDLTERRTRIADAYRAMQRDVESDSVNFVAGKHSKGSSCCGHLYPHYSQTNGYIVNDEDSIEIMSSTKSDGDSGINVGDESECDSANEDGRGSDQLSSTSFRLEIEGDVDTDADS